MFLLECPRCHNRMKYQPSGNSNDVSNKMKRCVYCGKGFSVGKAIVKQL